MAHSHAPCYNSTPGTCAHGQASGATNLWRGPGWGWRGGVWTGGLAVGRVGGQRMGMVWWWWCGGGGDGGGGGGGGVCAGDTMPVAAAGNCVGASACKGWPARVAGAVQCMQLLVE